MSGLKSAYRTSGEIFKQASKLYQPGLLEQLKGIKEKDIVVVRGQYDHVETLLSTLKVPYELIEPESIESHNGGRVMFVNCKSYDGVSKGTLNAVKTFVREGGRVVTTDWSLGLISKAFP